MSTIAANVIDVSAANIHGVTSLANLPMSTTLLGTQGLHLRTALIQEPPRILEQTTTSPATIKFRTVSNQEISQPLQFRAEMVGDQNLQVIQQKDGSLGLIEHPGNNRLVLDQNRGVDQSTIFKFKSEMGARNEVTDQDTLKLRGMNGALVTIHTKAEPQECISGSSQYASTSSIRSNVELSPNNKAVQTTNKESKKGEGATRKPCPECGKLLTNVKEHVKSVHWQVKNYMCLHCEYSTSFKNDLVKHTVSRHSVKNEGFELTKSPDEQQQQQQQQPNELQQHQLQYSLHQQSVHQQVKIKGSNRAKNCEECGKSVVNMNEHIRYVHRKEKNFQCGQCQYKTLFKSDLLKHEKAVHLGIRKPSKKKVCGHCGKHVSNLSEHVRFVHHHAKNFKCDHCAYACVKPADLRKHIVAVHKFGKVKDEQQAQIPPNIIE